MMDEKVSRADLHFMLQNKPTFDDIKHLMDSMGGAGSLEQVEDDLTKMRQRIEELQKDINRKFSYGSGISQGKDFQSFTIQVDQKLAEIDERVNDKANKQTVAQALHRKANKPEIEAALAKKAEISDL